VFLIKAGLPQLGPLAQAREAAPAVLAPWARTLREGGEEGRREGGREEEDMRRVCCIIMFSASHSSRCALGEVLQ